MIGPNVQKLEACKRGQVDPSALLRHGAEILSSVEAFLDRFVSYPSEEARTAHVLWIAHTHAMGAWESTPRLAFLSPEPASGKTRALEVTELLVPNPVQTINATPAYLFRKVGDRASPPTVLYDEIDSVFGPKAKENEELRALLNAGHRRGAVAGRCVVRGKTIETEEIPAYCAVALAGLGELPDTLLSRSVVIRMRRRSPGEEIHAFRHRTQSPEGHALRDELAAWMSTRVDELRMARPEMPDGVEDRAADMWEPLLAIADAAGGDWPTRALVAAVALVAQSRETSPSLGIRLLADLRSIFGAENQLATTEILRRLCAMEEAPWGNLKGSPLDARRLARLLGQYDLRSKTIRQGEGTPRGYRREDFLDVWERYLLAPPVPGKSATSATSATGDLGDLV